MVVLWCGRNKHVVVVTDKRIGGSAASSGLFRGANTSSKKKRRPSLWFNSLIDIRVLFRHNSTVHNSWKMSTSFALFRADILLNVLLLEYELVKNMSNEVDLNDEIMEHYGTPLPWFLKWVASTIYSSIVTVNLWSKSSTWTQFGSVIVNFT